MRYYIKPYTPAKQNNQTKADFTAEGGLVGLRLDVFLTRVTELSRSRAASLIEEGSVTLTSGGKSIAASKKYCLKPGDRVSLTLPELRPTVAVAEDIPIDIVYEDEDLLVVNKPSGMVVHPAAGHYSGTLVNALLYRLGDRLSGIGGEARPGIVHRLDRDTSGLMLVAKNDSTHLALSEMLAAHDIRRIYFALLRGRLPEAEGRVELPIGRHPTDRKKMSVGRPGETGRRLRTAATNYRVIREFSPGPELGGSISLVRFSLETGRTHQIRVHMAAIGHPLIGDRVYGGGESPFERRYASYISGQCLHSGELEFEHPRTGLTLHFDAPLPEGFAALLKELEKS